MCVCAGVITSAYSARPSAAFSVRLRISQPESYGREEDKLLKRRESSSFFFSNGTVE